MIQDKADFSKSVPFFVALDLPDVGTIRSIAQQLAPLDLGFKIGSEAFLALGRSGVEQIVALGRPVFLDLKWFDIPNTVAAAVRVARQMGVQFATVHLLGGEEMLQRAQDEAGEQLSLLGVTVLTSFSPVSWSEATSFARPGSASLSEAVLYLTERGVRSGLPGIVCSGDELPLLSDYSIQKIVPGVRWGDGVSNDDQSRTHTPEFLWCGGATSLVIGRPILRAADPVAQAKELIRQYIAIGLKL